MSPFNATFLLFWVLARMALAAQLSYAVTAIGFAATSPPLSVS
jgi:hypothetical protein